MSKSLRLLQTPASPFARKVRMAALVKRVHLDLEEAMVNPGRRNIELGRLNPLAKIPVLITPEGVIYDSRSICRYIDAKGHGDSLYDGPDQWAILRLEALADGIMEAAVLLRYELTSRPPELVWDQWVDAQFARIDAALEMLDAGEEELDALNMGTLALGAALEYLGFRHPDFKWQDKRQNLSKWLEGRAGGRHMVSTRYPA